MEIQDLIVNSLNRIEDKLDKHISSHSNGLTAKEWGIIAGMVTTICTCISGIAVLIFK